MKIEEKIKICVISDNEGYASDHVLQLVSKSKMLAECYGMEVSVACIGAADQEAFKLLGNYGADKILFCEQQRVLSVSDYSLIIEDMLRHQNPQAVLFTASSYGKKLAAVLSTRFESGLTADCTDIQYNAEEGFLFFRAAINDSVIVKIIGIHCRCIFGTVKKNVFMKKSCPRSAAVNVINYDFRLKEQQIQDQPELFNIMKAEEKTVVEVNKYSIVFCIGRGVNEEIKNRIFRLAELCHAVVVGTRAVVEDNLIEKDRQVGQSGKSISPKLYIGFGVSGASQHLVGIRNADTVIAVNNDENAAIFNYADYSIIEDVETVVSEMERLFYMNMEVGQSKEKLLQAVNFE